MRYRLGYLWTVAVVLASAPPATADNWPVAGGTPSRSGNAAMDPGETPITSAWNVPDGRVRTPIVITGGGGPDVQRVAYGTADGYAHLRLLASGAPVGEAKGVDMDSGAIGSDDARVFGSGAGSVGFADTSTTDRLGQLYVIHNDDAAGSYSVFVAKLRLDTGELVSEEVVPSSVGCSIDASPALTSPAAGGSRILYFTMTCPLYRYLVRVPIEGDAASPASTAGDYGFAMVPELNEVGSPALVVARDAVGTPRFHVAVGRRGGLSLFDAEDPLEASPGTTVTPPAITAALADPAEVAQSPAAPAAVSGLAAGAQGSGTDAPPALFVAADAGGSTKVYRFVQDGGARTLRADRVGGPFPDSGRPAPGMAVAETITPAGLSAGGKLVITAARNALLLRTDDLAEVGRASSAALGDGSGFARSAAAVSGAYAYLVRDGAPGVVPEHVILRIDGWLPVMAPAFARAPDAIPGAIAGQPAIARGTVVFGTARGSFAYTTRDVTGPAVELVAPAPDASVSGTVGISARVGDPRGVEEVTLRLVGSSGPARVIGRVTQATSGSGFESAVYTSSFPTASVANGDYLLEAAAADAAGNTTTSARRRIRIANPAGLRSLPPGACVNLLTGTSHGDRIIGSTAGDRILGGRGNDRLDGGPGQDCILGERGNDVLRGGTGNDRLLGGPGNDVLVGGAGSNRFDGGAGNDRILAANGRRDVVSCGKGRDRVSADRQDRVSRSCERVTRRRR